MPLLVRRRKD